MTKKKKSLNSWQNTILFVWITLSELFVNGYCLKDLKIFVPEAVIMGNAATLTCQYDLGQATLYSVRWYFESEEFYRYVPKESPPARTFPVSGINVDLSQSDTTSVTLRGVTRDLSGQFQCEVSEDLPLFHTDLRVAKMQVIELPKEDPIMQIDKKVVAPTDNFKAVCTVGTSFPPANITWFINGKKVYKTPFQRIVYRSFEGTPTYSSLELYPHSQIIQDIFQTMPPFQTSITILCEISILHIYHKNVQQRLFLSDLTAITTISPNLLGLDGSNKQKKNGGPNGNGAGDPDNSPLTGNSIKLNFNIISLIILFLFQFLFL